MKRPAQVYRTYRYRVYPTKRQALALDAQLGFGCELYNAALEQRRYAWRDKRPVGLATQSRQLSEVWCAKDGPLGMNYSAMMDPLRRLDRVFERFARRISAGHDAGFPRFRSHSRYETLTWQASWSLAAGRLVLPGIGHLKVKWHRALPSRATLCTATIRRQVGSWYAGIVVLRPVVAQSDQVEKPAVGLDLGVQSFAALSTGEIIPGPRSFRAGSKRLRIAQRRVSRRAEGSRRRKKAGVLVARVHERIRNKRRNHAHQLSRRLVSDFGQIAVEALDVRDLAQGSIAKDVADQGWGQFVRLLDYKAEEAGIQVVHVKPAGTSKVCSSCLTSIPKPLTERTHQCPDCGLVLDRDVNAARNILRLGTSRQASTWPEGERSLRKLAGSRPAGWCTK